MRSDSRTGPPNYRSGSPASENYLRGIPVRNPGVKIGSPMKARNPLLLVFAATFALWGPVAERIVAAQTPDPAPTPSASAPAQAPDPEPTPPAPAAAPQAPAPQASAPQTPAAAPSSAGRHISQLSKKEADAKLKALPDEERRWLEYVAPII